MKCYKMCTVSSDEDLNLKHRQSLKVQMSTVQDLYDHMHALYALCTLPNEQKLRNGKDCSKVEDLTSELEGILRA